MYSILSGTEVSKAILFKAKNDLAKFDKKPKLVIVYVGNDPASEVYVGMKIKKAQEIGMDAELKKLPDNTNQEDLLTLVNALNKDSSVTGFIVQLPLPKHIDTAKIIGAIDPAKDVDGFTPTNIGKLFLGISEESILLSATPAGVIKMLEHYKVDFKGKHAVVVGRSNIVGKPVASMLLNRNATVTICHSGTKNLADHTKTADILIVAVGKPKLITADLVKKGAYVIDVGTSKVNDKLYGDVDFENVIKKAHCSPVPKGVGPMTVAMLLSNVVKAKMHQNPSSI
ncbi:bifunctional 5,10-methylenetetrahydrofolate dehydrogenase/5,10-methenyltetrahydrofolate cyclohydrolase [Candidatus Micrarchaeota archaeon]|nr:bifunctional 5,10-methylenetetrahydrofolate dehydrogenase/5,10-methenyltetrahydrofolate cyclohydrolase [Candidatus Micrarchaeota archaeon]MBU1166261.1 bifunctional 5,10-methylenetetrahydrofolate dehydrogenase/5,10-methenyltetrahydrofolate cyclohydrolase [Candidatus Micrarchaeota archaeon]MBU1886715.1 bifunctional 5,10-methylenetetrahydrofolate dehydrogenase/5,10-methenyltetrahydrofolate cyclohydrolase [Candidatus Micrarchaeota archaeon]